MNCGLMHRQFHLDSVYLNVLLQSVCNLWENTINLFSVYFCPFQPEEATEPTSMLVPFLQKYSDTRNKKPSVSVSSDPGDCSHTVILKMFEMHTISDHIEPTDMVDNNI